MPPELDAGDLAALLRPWRFSEPLEIAPIRAQGRTSATWSVRAGDKRFVAKLIRDGRPYAEPGLRVAAAVDAGGVRTGAPTTTADGELCVEVAVDDRPGTLALLRYVAGRPLDLAEPDAPALAGALLGRVHAILLRDSACDWVPAALLDWFGSYLGASPHAGATAALATLRSLDQQGELTSAVIYGDPSPEILVDEATGELALIDWGTPSWGPLLHDVACWTLFLRDDASRDRFLLEYRRFVALAPRELEALPHFHELARALTAEAAA